jgi:ribose/xylose/arabinose/galactoside ABC-type transport system permease subunit
MSPAKANRPDAMELASPPKPPGGGGTVVNLLQAGARLAALAVIFIAFGLVVGPSFFKAGNVENILRQSAVFAMAGLGMTMVIITAGIDLAAGSTIALSMVVTAMILKAGGPDAGYLNAHPFLWTLTAVIGGTLAATLVGITQGVLITGLNLVPFIVTLGGLEAIRGLTKGVANNEEITPPHNWLAAHLMFPVQGQTFNWQLAPVGVWATLFAALIAAALLRYTKLGRHIYAVGSNEATARLCGVSVNKTKIIVYGLAGLFAGLAGVLEFSKLNIGQPTGAVSYELYVIAACVIGGTSLMGGVGTITGTVIGALMIGTLNIGAQQAEWPKWLQEIAIGVIIVAAAALDQLRARVRN